MLSLPRLDIYIPLSYMHPVILAAFFMLRRTTFRLFLLSFTDNLADNEMHEDLSPVVS